MLTFNDTCVCVYRIRNIKALESTYTIEASISYAWRDDSIKKNLNGTEDGETYTACTDRSKGCMSAWSDIGTKKLGPSLIPIFPDALSVSTFFSEWKVINKVPEWTNLSPDNLAWYVIGTQVISLTVLKIQNLRKFPFDSQNFPLRLTNLQLPTNFMDLRLVQERYDTMRPNELYALSARELLGFLGPDAAARSRRIEACLRQCAQFDEETR